MSCCIFLVRDLTGKPAFDPARLRMCLEPLPGVHGWSNRRSLFCEFDFNGDSTIINLINESRCISIEGMGDASLQVALEIQKRYGDEIHAIDEACSFCIPLSTVSSLADFNDKIVSEFGHEKLERKQ